MLLGRFFINKNTWRMELDHLDELDEKIIENVSNDPNGLTIVYSDKEGVRRTMIVRDY